MISVALLSFAFQMSFAQSLPIPPEVYTPKSLTEAFFGQLDFLYTQVYREYKIEKSENSFKFTAEAAQVAPGCPFNSFVISVSQENITNGNLTRLKYICPNKKSFQITVERLGENIQKIDIDDIIKFKIPIPQNGRIRVLARNDFIWDLTLSNNESVLMSAYSLFGTEIRFNYRHKSTDKQVTIDFWNNQLLPMRFQSNKITDNYWHYSFFAGAGRSHISQATFLQNLEFVGPSVGSIFSINFDQLSDFELSPNYF